MPSGAKPTANEHFIPRMYLRNFSEFKGSEKALVWQFCLKSMRQTPVQVNVDDICYKKHLYEIKSSDGSFIAQNTIEKTFGKLETQASNVIHSIIRKTQNEECLNCPSVLSEEDKGYLIIFITSLLYRDPTTIENGIKWLLETNPDMDIREARNFTLMNLLPLGVDPTWDENTIIRTAISNLEGMAFQIGIANEDVIITSDRPVVMWLAKGAKSSNRPQAVAFPLSSRLLLYLFPAEIVDPIARNCFIRLSKEQIDDFCWNTAVFARNWIYSKTPFTDEQLTLILDARGKLQNTSAGK